MDVEKRNILFVVRKKNVKTTAIGRPKIQYKLLTERSKRRRKTKLRTCHTQLELSDAILKNKEKNVKNIVSIRNNALSLYMDMTLTKKKYQMLRYFNKKNQISNEKFPEYGQIFAAKTDCYPANIDVSDCCASVPVQNLLDHTVFRLICSLSTDELQKINNKDMVLKCKWGMDGASGQQRFKQNFQNESTSDNSVFSVMMVPLELCVSNQPVWINRQSNSTRLCRVISFEFVKETKNHTLQTFDIIQKQINSLNATILEDVCGISCTVHYSLQCSMVDGKTINILTNQQSSASCNVCRATPKQMNSLNIVNSLTCNPETFQFGLSPLHCRIRFMECVLHIAYNLDFMKGSARGDNKCLKETRKKAIQQKLKEKLGLTVDVVKQGK